MATKVQWAVIGSGGIARRRTIPEGIVAAANAELRIVFDVNAEANREVANECGARAAESIEDILESDAGAVYVATPANLHYEQAMACCRAGKNVLCEKPLGMTVPEVEEMLAAFRDADLRLGAGFMMRFSAQHRAALSMIQDGRLGALVYGRAQLSCWYPPMAGNWRQDPKAGGGGSLMDMGGHCIDLLEMFFGELESVSCFVNNTVHDYKSEDSATVILRFANGALATVDTFFNIPDAASRNVLELYGSRGSILASGTIGQEPAGEMTAYLEAEGAAYEAQQARGAAEGIAISPEPVNTYRAEIEEFSQAIVDGREPLHGGELGLRSQRVLSACYESARTGRAMQIV